MISVTTNFESKAAVEANDKEYKGRKQSTYHEIKLDGLKPGSKIDYKVLVGDYKRESWFKTPPEKGTCQPFTFAFTSDSRAGKGGGECNVYGTNAYVVKKMAALAVYEGTEFLQYTGDLISGYTTDRQYSLLQYQNCKRAIEPFAHRIPFVLAPGNHEAALSHIFRDSEKAIVAIDKFPWDTPNLPKQYLAKW